MAIVLLLLGLVVGLYGLGQFIFAGGVMQQIAALLIILIGTLLFGIGMLSDDCEHLLKELKKMRLGDNIPEKNFWDKIKF